MAKREIKKINKIESEVEDIKEILFGTKKIKKTYKKSTPKKRTIHKVSSNITSPTSTIVEEHKEVSTNTTPESIETTTINKETIVEENVPEIKKDNASDINLNLTNIEPISSIGSTNSISQQNLNKKHPSLLFITNIIQISIIFIFGVFLTIIFSLQLFQQYGPCWKILSFLSINEEKTNIIMKICFLPLNIIVSLFKYWKIDTIWENGAFGHEFFAKSGTNTTIISASVILICLLITFFAFLFYMFEKKIIYIIFQIATIFASAIIFLPLLILPLTNLVIYLFKKEK